MSFAGIRKPNPKALPSDMLSPSEYRDFVKNEILPYIDEALSFEAFVILYSGPSDKIWKSGYPDIKGNNKLSANMAMAFRKTYGFKVSRINNTKAAKELNKHNLTAYFTKYYSHTKPHATNKEIDDFTNAAYAEVWRGLSELFAKREFRHAATAVCGADRSRVFVKDELPALVNTSHLETINGIDFDAVRRIYKEVSPDEAFRLVCLSEINFIYNRTSSDKRIVAKIQADAKRRTHYYDVERSITARITPKLTAKQEKNLKKIIGEFSLNALYATQPQNWSGPVMSSTIPLKTGKALGMP